MEASERYRITQSVKASARDAGFAEVGVARIETLEAEFDRYREWLGRGYNATLGYMDRNHEKRRDPTLIVPGARSVIVVAQNYYTAAARQESSEHGKISRYAWGDDYHDVMPPKMRAVCAELERLIPGAESKVYTDTGPVLEKQWAARAGIGWQGKHSNVISRNIGSWFFIGVIITTAELTPDDPIGDYCGSCTACIDACPTDAIVEPYVVDAGKCLSFWTIETKPDVDIPLPIAERMEGWIFGCDICQDVCPWNRFETPTDETRFQPRSDETRLRYTEVAAYSQEDFSTRFRKSPIKRTKMAGLKRNAQAASARSVLRENDPPGK